MDSVIQYTSELLKFCFSFIRIKKILFPYAPEALLDGRMGFAIMKKKEAECYG